MFGGDALTELSSGLTGFVEPDVELGLDTARSDDLNNLEGSGEVER